MRNAVFGVLAGAALMFVLGGMSSGSNRALAVGPSRASAGSGQLIALAASVDEHRQQITVIDPASRVMSVYHIELATGKVTLKSVRKIYWDLEMSDFNAASPLPQEIRKLLEQRR